MEGINPAIRILVSCNLNFNSTDRNPQKQLQDFRIWINALFTLTPAVNTCKGTAKLNHGDTEARSKGGRERGVSMAVKGRFFLRTPMGKCHECLPLLEFSLRKGG